MASSEAKRLDSQNRARGEEEPRATLFPASALVANAFI